MTHNQNLRAQWASQGRFAGRLKDRQASDPSVLFQTPCPIETHKQQMNKPKCRQCGNRKNCNISDQGANYLILHDHAPTQQSSRLSEKPGTQVNAMATSYMCQHGCIRLNSQHTDKKWSLLSSLDSVSIQHHYCSYCWWYQVNTNGYLCDFDSKLGSGLLHGAGLIK